MHRAHAVTDAGPLGLSYLRPDRLGLVRLGGGGGGGGGGKNPYFISYRTH
jgi:hypothetical protein